MRIIKVQGKGRVNVDPDLVTLSFEIDNITEDYGECLLGLNTRVEDLRASMAKAGFKRAELKTTNFNVVVETEYNENTGHYDFVGYRASHNLRIKFPLEKELLNQVMRLVSQGYSGAEINLAFSVTDKDGLHKRALAQAVLTARENAETLAVSAGVKLGKLIEINYGWAEVHVYDRASSMVCESNLASRASYDIDIEPEDVIAEDNVTLVFEVAD